MEEGRGLPCFLTSNEEEDGREKIVSDITQLVGWTPLIELKQIVKKDGVDVRLVGKIESYQPLSSVKDRGALRMIEDAEEKGLITPGITTLLEPTSGNLGISLAYIALRKGYKYIAVMQAHFPLEKRILLRHLGAEVLITDPALGFQGQLQRVEQMKVDNPNIHVLDQFANPANPEAHFMSTGPEIWKDTAGRVDILVCGSGSGGTLSGAGRYLKMKNPALKVICVEPAESPVISALVAILSKMIYLATFSVQRKCFTYAACINVSIWFLFSLVRDAVDQPVHMETARHDRWAATQGDIIYREWGRVLSQRTWICRILMRSSRSPQKKQWSMQEGLPERKAC